MVSAGPAGDETTTLHYCSYVHKDVNFTEFSENGLKQVDIF